MTDALHAALLDALVQLVLVPLAAAVAAWAFTKLPGPARDWLQSGTHARDVQLLLGAMARRAAAHLAPGAAAAAVRGRGPVADVVDYARASLPEVVNKLAPSPDALRTMAAAAIQEATAEALKARAAAPVTVGLSPAQLWGAQLWGAARPDGPGVAAPPAPPAPAGP